MPNRAPVRSLIAVLLVEAAQAERNVRSHCGREADRLGSTPPGWSMRAVANRAQRALRDLRPLAEGRSDGSGPGEVPLSRRIGRMLSEVRELGADIRLSTEKSYRATLLEIHQAAVAFLLLEDAAVAAGDQELADYCHRWLADRTRLIGDVERDLAWFAANPERALGRAMPPFLKRLQRVIPLPEVLRESINHPINHPA
jgi:hypothetical protein